MAALCICLHADAAWIRRPYHVCVCSNCSQVHQRCKGFWAKPCSLMRGRWRVAGRLSAAEEAQLGMRRGRSAFAAPPLPSDSLPLETRRRRHAARPPGDGSTGLQTGSGGGATSSAEPSYFSDPRAPPAQVRRGGAGASVP